jgi:hypothetical protein
MLPPPALNAGGEGLMATVAHWPYSESLPVAGLSVEEVRRRYADRFDIDPLAEAIIDGLPADTSTIVSPGQLLMFVRRAGEKGSVVIERDQAWAVSREGQKRSLDLDRLMSRLAPPRADTGCLVLPDGVKAVLSRGSVTILVHQTPPQTYNFNWITDASKTKFGRGTNYKPRRLALPYLIVLATYIPADDGRIQLSDRNECFFRNQPLSSLDDPLLYPALLNISKVDDDGTKPLAWICTQHLDRSPLARIDDPNARVRASFKALMTCLLGAGFNLSSEFHEGASHYGASRGVDPRIATVEHWEKASAQRPLFALEVPWVATGYTVRQVAERTFRALRVPDGSIRSCEDIERIIFNSR